MAVYYTQVSHISPEVVPLIDAKKQLKMEDLGTFDDELIQDCIDAAIDECVVVWLKIRKHDIQHHFEYRVSVVVVWLKIRKHDI